MLFSGGEIVLPVQLFELFRGVGVWARGLDEPGGVTILSEQGTFVAGFRVAAYLDFNLLGEHGPDGQAGQRHQDGCLHLAE